MFAVNVVSGSMVYSRTFLSAQPFAITVYDTESLESLTGNWLKSDNFKWNCCFTSCTLFTSTKHCNLSEVQKVISFVPCLKRKWPNVNDNNIAHLLWLPVTKWCNKTNQSLFWNIGVSSYIQNCIPFTDPCLTLNCQHICVNERSGPKCICYEGFILGSNNITCIGIGFYVFLCLAHNTDKGKSYEVICF